LKKELRETKLERDILKKSSEHFIQERWQTFQFIMDHGYKESPGYQGVDLSLGSGIQFACNEFRNLLDGYQLVRRSMSRKGYCWDNAVADSFFMNLKVEWVYHKKYRSRMQAALSVFEYIESWYNTERIHATLEMSIKDFSQININQKQVA
jgi:transposase InsO family protein